VTLTERGWNWLERNADYALPRRATATDVVFSRALANLKPRLESGELTLAQLFGPRLSVEVAAQHEQIPQAAPLDLCLIDACRRIAGEPPYGKRIRLSAIRHELADVPRRVLDIALRDLERRQTVAIYPLDDPREIGPEDERSALSSSRGTRPHVLYLSHS
jgi:hypothetical protein